MNSNSVRIGSSVYPNGMTSEQWNTHSQGTQLTGYADVNPKTSVYPNGMTSEQWSEQVALNGGLQNGYKVNEDNVTRYVNRISMTLAKMENAGN